jgi:hypothetical protein
LLRSLLWWWRQWLLLLLLLLQLWLWCVCQPRRDNLLSRSRPLLLLLYLLRNIKSLPALLLQC